LRTAPSVALGLDGWSDHELERYFALTAHWATEDGQLHTMLTDFFEMPGQHTAEKVMAEVQKSFERMAGENTLLSTIVTDNASMERKVASLCSSDSVSCGSHTVQLAKLSLASTTRLLRYKTAG
jgi:hypothetical protein